MKYSYRFDKKTGICKIFKWENAKSVYVRSLGSAEKLHKKLLKYESGDRARSDLLKLVKSGHSPLPNQG